MSQNSPALDIAKQLRKRMTKEEQILWGELRNKKFGNIKFRRQMPLVFGEYKFVVDFYCASKRLIIEVDGPIHEHKDIKEYDIEREEILRQAGYKIFRIKNKEINNNLLQTLNNLEKYIKEL